MADLNTTATFRANIANLKKAMQEATRSVKLASAEFKAATAGMDDWGSSADGLEAKLKQLDTVLIAQNKQLELQKKELENTVAAYGENSAAADRCRIAIFNQEAAIKKTESEIEKYNKKLTEVNAASDSATDGTKEFDSASSKLNSTINEQEKELEELKKAYVDAKLDGNTEAAEEYANAIEDLSGDLAENKSKMAEAEKAADELDKSMESAGQGAKTAGDGFTVFKGVVSNLVSSGLKALGRKAVELAKDAVKVGAAFEESMSKVEAISGATGSNLEALRNKAQELGRTTRFSASEAADALSNMALAGWDTQQMLTGIDGVLQLAAASGMDLATASDVVAGNLAAFNMSASESTRLADLMAQAQAKSKTTADQLAEAYSTCATNLTQAGQSTETTTALLEGLASVNDTGSAAGTKLSAAMSSITQKMKDGKIAIGETQVAVTNADGSFRDMVDIIADVEAATDGMTNAERASALQKTFNRQSMATMNELLAVGSDRLSQYKEELENSDGAAAAMASTMTNNLNGALTEMNSAAEGLGIAFYNLVSDKLTGAVKIATGLIGDITNAITPQKTELESFIDDIDKENERLNALVDAAEKDAENAKAKAGELEAYKDIILELQEVINNGGELDAYQLYEMQNAVNAVKDEIPEIAENFDDVTGAINLSTEAINDLFQTASTNAEAAAYQRAIATETQAVADAHVNLLKAESAVKKATEELTDANEKNAQSTDYMTGGYGDYYIEVSKAEDALKKANKAEKEAQQTYDESKASLDTLENALSDLGLIETETAEKTEEAAEANTTFSESEEEAAEVAANAQQKIADAHTNASQTIVDAYNIAKNAAGQAFDINPFEKWEQNAESGLDAFQSALESQVEGLTQYSDNLQILSDHVGQEITPQFMQAVQDMGTSGAQLVQELASALESGDTDRIESVMQTYVTAMDERDEIARIMAGNELAIQLGLNQLGSSASEWGNIEEKVSSALSGLDSSISSKLQTAFSSAEQTARELGVAIPEGLAEGIEDADNAEAAVENAIAQLESAASGAIDGLITVAKDRGIEIPEGIKAGIEDGSMSVQEAYETLLSLISDTSVLSTAESAANEAGASASEGFGTGVSDGESNVTSAAEGVASAGAEAAGQKEDEYKSAGEKAGEGFASGVTAKESEAKKSGTDVGKSAVDGMKSQEKAAKSSGENVGKNFASGVSGQASSARSAGSSIGSSAVSGAASGASGMGSAGSSAGASFASGVSSQSGAASSAGSSLARSAQSGASGISAYSSGVNFGQGFINGIGAMVSAAYARAYALARSAWQGLKAGQQEGSPSKLTYQSGKWFTQGYINGIAVMEKSLKKTVNSLAESAVKTLVKSTFDFSKTGEASAQSFATAFQNRANYLLNKISYQNQQNIEKIESKINSITSKKEAAAEKLQAAGDKRIEKIEAERDKKIEALEEKRDAEKDKNKKEALKKQIAKEKDAYKKTIENEKSLIKKQIAESNKLYQKEINAQKKYQKEYQEASAAMISEFTTAIDEYQARVNDLIETTIGGITEKYNAKYESLLEKQDNLIAKMRQADDLFNISDAGVITVNDIKQQTAQIKDYASKLTKIRKKVSAELFDQISEYDMKEGSAFIDQLLGMSKKELEEYDKAFTEKMNVTSSVAQKLYKKDFTQIKKDYKQEINDAFADIPKQVEKIARDVVKGFVNGLTKNTDYMKSGVKTIVSEMVKEFKKELKINSPSKLTFDLGEYTGEGFADGLKSMIQRTKKAASDLVSAAASPLEASNVVDIQSLVSQGSGTGIASTSSNVVNNYNLVQNNTSPKALTALETYQARRRQIAMIQAFG